MKLREYMRRLEKIKAKYGDDLEMVYSIDDEGNAYHSIYYHPSIGVFENDEWVCDPDKTPNSVCVN